MKVMLDLCFCIIYNKEAVGCKKVLLRDKAIISLLLHTGISGIDIINLKLQSVDWNSDVIRLIQSKTKKELELPAYFS